MTGEASAPKATGNWYDARPVNVAFPPSPVMTRVQGNALQLQKLKETRSEIDLRRAGAGHGARGPWYAPPKKSRLLSPRESAVAKPPPTDIA